jgi:hypothetical protein
MKGVERDATFIANNYPTSSFPSFLSNNASDISDFPDTRPQGRNGTTYSNGLDANPEKESPDASPANRYSQTIFADAKLQHNWRKEEIVTNPVNSIYGGGESIVVSIDFGNTNS